MTWRKLPWTLGLIALLAATLIGYGILRVRTARVLHAAVSAPPPELAQLPAELKQRYEAAQAAARSWIDPAPGLITLARLSHANGFSADAANVWTALIAIDPRNAHWHHYLADARLQLGDETGTLAALQQTVELAPTYSPAWLRLAKFQLKLGNLDLARTAFERRLALAPGDPHARVGLARILRLQGDSAAALTALRSLAEDHPNFSPGQNLYAAMLRETGDTAAADHHQLLGSAAQRFTEAPDPWLEALQPDCYLAPRWLIWGTIAWYGNQPEEARRCFARAITLAPEKSEGHEMLGLALKDLHQNTAAAAALEQAVACHDATDITWLRLGRAEEDNGNLPGALQTAAAGLERFPRSAVLHNLRGGLLFKLGRDAEAIPCFQTALDLDPNIAEPALNRANLYLHAGRRDLARADLDEALARQPGYPLAMALLAGLETEAGELESARRRLDPLQRDYPNLTVLPPLFVKWFTQAMLAAMREGDPNRAVALGQEAVQRWPDNAPLHGLLGTILAQLGRANEALVALEASRTLAADDPRTVTTLAQLYLSLNRLPDARRVVAEAHAIASARGATALAQRFEAILTELPR